MVQTGFEHKSDSKAIVPLHCANLAFEVLSITPASSLDSHSSQQVPELAQLILSSHGPTDDLTREIQLSILPHSLLSISSKAHFNSVCGGTYFMTTHFADERNWGQTGLVSCMPRGSASNPTAWLQALLCLPPSWGLGSGQKHYGAFGFGKGFWLPRFSVLRTQEDRKHKFSGMAAWSH